jgi:hypothetical protein
MEATPEYRSAEQSIRMMRRLARGTRPWHLEIHFVAPHDACLPLKRYLDLRSTLIPVRKSFQHTFTWKPGMHCRESESWGPITEAGYRQSRAYYACTNNWTIRSVGF